LNPRKKQIITRAALIKKATSSPANSATIPPTRGLGIRAMLATDCAIPSMPPCSSAGVLLEMKLGRTVFNVPMPDEIRVIEATKTIMLGYRGIKNIPSASSREPKTMRFS